MLNLSYKKGGAIYDNRPRTHQTKTQRTRIEYCEDSVKVSSVPRKEHIRSYLRKDMDIKNKGPDDQKRIIKTYIQKVTVYPDHIEIYSEMDTTDGAEPYLVVSISTYTHEPSRGLYYKHVATKLE